LHTLHSMDIQVSVAWIPGHSGICYNERADMAAKEALRLDNKIVNGSITLASCKRLVAKHINISVNSGKPDGNDLQPEELHMLSFLLLAIVFNFLMSEVVQSATLDCC